MATRAGTTTQRSGSKVRDRIVELIRIRAGDLAPNPKNWRRHPERQRAALRALLREVGYADALLARRVGSDLVLIDGHLRKSLDPEQLVPVLVLDLDEQEAEKLLLTLDPLAALATPEAEPLAALLGRVESSSVAVQELLSTIARSAGLPPLRFLTTDPDQLPEQPDSRTKSGDLWALGEHRLLCGDARNVADLERLMDGAADVLFTDPPYGVSYEGKTPRSLRIEGDSPEGLSTLLNDAFNAVSKVLAPGAAIYLCHPAGAQSFTFLQAFFSQGWRFRQGLVWVKDSMVLGHADYQYRHEPIAFGYAPGGGRRGRGGSGWYGNDAQDTVIEVPRPKSSRDHPTMKPVELIRRLLVNSCPEGGRVLDPFAGSGTTLIAAELLGVRADLCEIDPSYCDVVLARWEELTGQEARLADPSG